MRGLLPILGCLGVLAAAPVRAQPAPPQPKPPLQVGVAGTPPFVIRSGGELSGLSVDVWRALARREGLSFELQPIDSVSDALAQVQSGKLDVAVGPLSITSERLETVDFTHRYYESSLAILAPRVTAGPLAWLRPFWSRAFLFGVVLLLTVLLGVGVLLWLAERRENPEHFPQTPLRGIGNGVWMALVTMTTVGYGDRVPVTTRGRIVTGAWMLIAMITASSLTAGIASALTLQNLEGTAIKNAEQLRNRRVATVSDSTAAGFAARSGARVVGEPDLPASVEALTRGKADAVVFDRPMLQYYLQQHPTLPLDLADRTYEPQGYGFAVPIGSGLGHRLDIQLEALRERGELKAILRRWLGD